VTDDPRDEQLGDALAVPALDDVTRRRLVHNALAALDQEDETAEVDQPRGSRSWAPLVAAAVVILLVVVGFVALGRGGDDSSSDTAARKTDRVPTAETPTGQAPTAAAESSNGAAASLVPRILDLGDLGNLSSPVSRERTRTALTTGTLTDSDAATALAADRLQQDVAGAVCAAPLRADGTTIVGVGTATVDGDDAVVVVTETAGARAAFVLVLQPCALSPL
jgi:hypothetical protein